MAHGADREKAAETEKEIDRGEERRSVCLDGQRGRGVKKKDKDANANVDMDVDVDVESTNSPPGCVPNAIDVCAADAGAWQCLGRAH